MLHTCKKLFSLSFLVCGFTVLPLFAHAIVDDTVVLWSSGGNIVQRSYGDTAREVSAVRVAISGVRAKFLALRAHPLNKQEYLLGVQDYGGVLRIYRTVDLRTWQLQWEDTIGDSDAPRFDVAFEQSTGNAMVAYRGALITINSGKNKGKGKGKGNQGSTASYVTMNYRLMPNKGVWGVEQSLTLTSAEGTIAAMRLASRSDTREIGLVYFDEDRAAGAAFWNGSQWSPYTSSITTNGTKYNGHASLYPPMQNYDVAFESISGDMIVVAGENSNDHMKYVTRNAKTGAWSAVAKLATLQSYADYSRLIPDRKTDKIALSACMMEPKIPKYFCEYATWNGSSFGAVTTDITGGIIYDGDQPTDVIWLEDNDTTSAVSVYDDTDTASLDWAKSDNAGVWTFQGDDVTTPLITGHEGTIVAQRYPGVNNRGVFAISNSERKVFLRTLEVSNGVYTWRSPVRGATTAEIANEDNLVIADRYVPIAMAIEQVGTALVVGGATSVCGGVSYGTGVSLSARGEKSVTIRKLVFTQKGKGRLHQGAGFDIAISSGVGNKYGLLKKLRGRVVDQTVVFEMPANEEVVIPSKTTIQACVEDSGEGNIIQDNGTIALGIATSSDITLVPGGGAGADIIIDSTVIPKEVAIEVGSTITSYTNRTEPTLSFATNCIRCGGRIGVGGGAQEILISGSGFGMDPGVGGRSTSKNAVLIHGASTTTIAEANIRSWSPTEIVIRLDSGVSGNTDNDFGANYGGGNALVVRSNGHLSSGVTFTLLPQVLGVISPSSLGTNSAREYAASDTDGVITIQGTRFGGSQSGGKALVLGCSVSSCVNPVDSAKVRSWSNTDITVEVPAIINDSVYTGSLTVVTGTSTPIQSLVQSNFLLHIQPRLTAVTPALGAHGDVVVLTGNHFCPFVCPAGLLVEDDDTLGGDKFSASSSVRIGGATATYFGGWTHTSVNTKIPTAARIGVTVASLSASGVQAGEVNFTINTADVTGSVSGMTQMVVRGTSEQSLSVGGYASSSKVHFGGVLSVQTTSPNALANMEVEVLPVGVAFTCSAGACGATTAGARVPVRSLIDCKSLSSSCGVILTLPDEAYHWRSRSVLHKGSEVLYGPWSSFPLAQGNSENAIDLVVDTKVPVQSQINHSDVGVSSITLQGNTNEPSMTAIAMNTSGKFTNNCMEADGCRVVDSSFADSFRVVVPALSPGVTYYYRVQQIDRAGNATWSSVQSFTTSSRARPAKTLYFQAGVFPDLIRESASSSRSFSVFIPEDTPSMRSIFLDIRGLYVTQGTSGMVTIRVNNETERTYVLPNTEGRVMHYRFFHQVRDLSLSPVKNTLNIKTNSTTRVYASGADAVVTYEFTP